MSKRGRKRKAGKREPNGRLSRRKADVQVRSEETEYAAMDTARRARMRVYGLTEEQAMMNRLSIGRPNAGTVIGRMALQGALSHEQWAAGFKYGEVKADYHKAILARGEVKGGASLNGIEDSDEYAEWCARAIKQHDTMMSRLHEAACEERSSNVYAALSYFVGRDEYHRHMEGDLRIALNALAKLWGIGRRSDEAA